MFQRRDRLNFELLELLRQRTREPGNSPRYPQPHDPFSTELQVLPSEVFECVDEIIANSVMTLEKYLGWLPEPVATF